MAQLQALRDQLDPFALAEAIDAKLPAFCALAPPSPDPTAAATNPAAAGPAVKRQAVQARSESFGIPVSIGLQADRSMGKRRGNISNGATIRRKVTFLSGLTGGVNLNCGHYPLAVRY